MSSIINSIVTGFNLFKATQLLTLTILLVSMFLYAGCSSGLFQKNQLRNLSDKQAAWFERTSEGWRF
jgi:hypothetical protein